MQDDTTLQPHRGDSSGSGCEAIWDLLSAYVDGETTPVERAVVERHVAGCAECARDIEFLRGATLLLKQTPEVEPPATLRASILAATAHRPHWADRLAAAVRRAFAPAPIRYGSLAAAGAAAAIALIVLWENGGGPIRPVEMAATPPPVVAEIPPPAPFTPDIRPQPAPEVMAAPPLSASAQPENGVRVARNTPSKHSVRRASSTVHHALNAASRTTGAARRPSNPARPVVAQPVFAYKEKVAVNTPPVEEDMPERVEVAPNEGTAKSEAGMRTADMKVEPGAEPTAGARTSQPTRIVLTASAQTVDAGQIATLADLKRSLRQHSTFRLTPGSLTAARDRQIRLDVIKGSF